MTPIRHRTVVVGLLLGLLLADAASAGMPSLTLADVRRELSLSTLTRMRLETISFFLAGLLVVAAIIRVVWNGLRKDFGFLPRLTYAKALGLVLLWGLLFVLVLTMISGARELMTPGAWEKKGLTYQLVEEAASPVELRIGERSDALKQLWRDLRAHADRHEGKFPTPEAVGAIPESRWIVPGSGGRRYRYLGGVISRDEMDGVRTAIIAHEPDLDGPDRLVLSNDGSVYWLPIDEIERSLAREEP